ncbi:MAG: Ig-like domain-containing protein, partial [Dysgonamonadaceae bacterium]|nr:Ig-like domain-containing protein [Dysgonamonadaceae bacterium]
FLSFGLAVALIFGVTAQDVDYTHVVINSSFEYASDGTLLDADADGIIDDSHAGKGKDNATTYRVRNSIEQEFYAWHVSNWDFISGNNSQGMNRDISPVEKIHGTFAMWLGGNQQFKLESENTNAFEFYQIIDKDNLSAGTYKVQCLLAVEDVKRTSQRLFANSSVQYHGTESQYANNQTYGEEATFAGWPSGTSNLQEMVVYATIGEEDDLKIGIRTGNIKGDGTVAANANPLWGWFKSDYFRLTKLDVSAKLSALSLSIGKLSPEFDPGITEYTVVLPAGLQSVTPIAVAGEYSVIQSGTEAVDITSGAGVSTIVVKSKFDEASIETYTIHYTAGNDIDCTGLIINSSFEYASDGTPLDGDGDGVIDDSHADKGKTDATTYRVKNSDEKEYYGWSVSNWNFASTSNNSQGMNRDINPVEKIHGTFATWLGGDQQFKIEDANTNSFEFYQVIGKDDLSAGTYKVECRLAVADNKRTSQRLFANNSVQYHGTESQYANNQTDNEQATFAGHPDGEKNLQEMVVYATIGEEDDLKIGIRTGNIKGDGTVAANANPLWGWFKADYFRLTKLDVSAKLIGLSLPAGTLSPAFDPEITEYTATLPAGLQSITPVVTAGEYSVIQSGMEAVDVSSGFGVSTIVVKSIFDETSVETYTIRYKIDYTGLIINNSFEYASDGTLLDADGDGVIDDSHAGKGKDGESYRVKNSEEKEYYGWSVSNWDFASTSNTSQGMNRDMNPVEKIHGTFATWLGGDLQFKVDGENTNVFEFYQIIDKDDLPAGTYKVQSRLAVGDNKRTSQRLFANNSVQYHGTESQYAGNQTEGERATFAGWPNGEADLQEMTVYATVGEEDDLKIGIRTGNIKGDGTVADNVNPLWGWFKSDYFRLTKIDPVEAADATLASLTLSVGSLNEAFDPETTSYTADLPLGTVSVTPVATPNIPDATVTGVEPVNVRLGSGESIVTVTALDGTTTKTYTISYTVPTVSVTGVSLNETSAELEIDETLQLTATVAPEDATNTDVSWRSDDEAIATVSNDGLVIAIAEGTANIIVETADGAFKDTCRVTVITIAGIEAPGNNPSVKVVYANDILRIVNLEGYAATLFSVDGQTVARFRINTQDDSYLQSLPAGVYFLSVKKSGDRKVFKLIRK